MSATFFQALGPPRFLVTPCQSISEGGILQCLALYLLPLSILLSSRILPPIWILNPSTHSSVAPQIKQIPNQTPEFLPVLALFCYLYSHHPSTQLQFAPLSESYCFLPKMCSLLCISIVTTSAALVRVVQTKKTSMGKYMQKVLAFCFCVSRNQLMLHTELLYTEAGLSRICRVSLQVRDQGKAHATVQV